MDNKAGVANKVSMDRDSKASMDNKVADGADLIRVAMDKVATGVDLRVANKVIVNNAVGILLTREILEMIIIAMDNMEAASMEAADNLVAVNQANHHMVVADGAVNKEKVPAVKIKVDRLHNLAHHLKKEKRVNKIREIKTRTGIAKV